MTLSLLRLVSAVASAPHQLALRLLPLCTMVAATWWPAPTACAQGVSQQRSVKVEGNVRTRSKYIEHLTRDCLAVLPPGTAPTEADRLLRQCLLNSKIFSEVQVQSSRAAVSVHVDERWTLIPIPYLQVDTGQSRKIGVIMLESNFLGMGKLIASGASLSNQGVSFFGYYQDPAVLFTPWRTETLVDHTRENLTLYRKHSVVDSYAETTNGLLTGAGLPLGPDDRHRSRRLSRAGLFSRR